MIESRFEYLNLDESPPTIAYVMMVMLSGVLGLEIEVHAGPGEEWIVVTDGDEGTYFRLGVSPMMGRLLVAILEQTEAELSGTADEGW